MLPDLSSTLAASNTTIIRSFYAGLKSADFKVVSAPVTINPAIKIKSTFIFPDPQPVILEKGMILDYD